MAWSGFIGCSKTPPCWAASSIPAPAGGELLEAGFHELRPLAGKGAGGEKDGIAGRTKTPRIEMAVTAHGLAKAAEILAGQFTLVATNVPYLGRGKQDEALSRILRACSSRGKGRPCCMFCRTLSSVL